METVPNIINIQPDPIYPKKTITYDGLTSSSGPHNPPDPPPIVMLSYEPELEFSEKSAPVPGPSWASIRASGSVHMTDYFNRRTRTLNHLARSDGYAMSAFPWGRSKYSPSPVCQYKQEPVLLTSWTEQGDSRYWSEVVGVPTLLVSDNCDDEIQNAVATSQSSVIASFKGGFDFLTQTAESREALSWFAAKSDESRSIWGSLKATTSTDVKRMIRNGANARQLLKSTDVVARQLGRRWMEYRYAIMPLVYAYQDIKMLYDNVGRTYETFKSRERLEYSPSWPTGLPIRALMRRTSGTVDITSTIVAGYAPSGINSFVSSQLATNPLATAWELVPLSFVIDWFVNVGDYIIATTSMGLSTNVMGCTAVRKRLLLEEVLHDYRDIKLNYDLDVSNPCWPNGVHLKREFKNSRFDHTMVQELDHYDRVLFDVNTAKLSMYNYPLGNWKRVADSAALSYQPLKKLLRSLK